jgi:hypothetical protein
MKNKLKKFHSFYASPWSELSRIALNNLGTHLFFQDGPFNIQEEDVMYETFERIKDYLSSKPGKKQ